MPRILTAIDRSSRLVESIAVLLIYGYCGLMLAEVFARGVLRKSLPYSWEFSAFAMAGVFFLAAGPALRTAVHVRVSLILEACPPRVAKWVDVAANCIALLIVALLVEAVWSTVFRSLDRGLVSTSVVRTPLVFPQFLVLIGAIQLWLDLLARAIRRGTNLRHEDRGADAVPDEIADD